METQDQKHEAQCNICNDLEFVYNPETNAYKPCTCQEVKKAKRIMNRAGISEAFKTRRFESFDCNWVKGQEDALVNMKKMAMDYSYNYTKRPKELHNSIILTGRSGNGKTHLACAIANKLLDQGIGVVWMSYREALPDLKMHRMDEVEYAKREGKYRLAPVLFIDDLYKGFMETDLRIVYEIINYRYNNTLPMIITTEETGKQLVAKDEAIAGRIIEMCKGRVLNFSQIPNYRLKG